MYSLIAARAAGRVGSEGVHVGAVEVVTLGNRLWLEASAFDSLADRQHGDPPSLDVGLIEELLHDTGPLL